MSKPLPSAAARPVPGSSGDGAPRGAGPGDIARLAMNASVWRHDASPARRGAATLWQNAFFACAEHTPGAMRRLAPFCARAAWLCSPTLRDGAIANARWLLGNHSTASQRRRFSRAVVTSFFRFVCDVAEGARLAPADLRARILSVEGREHYAAARRLRKGAVIATAHLGSFEVGMAGLSEIEPRLHVVFKHDRLSRFERLRRRLHNRLGVAEAPIDEGWGAWMRLRDALLADEVVFMQADRAMPGQRAGAVPFCGGHIRVPIGPAKLAQITGSPIIPVFAIRHGYGVRIHVEPAITADRTRHDILLRIASVTEKYVRAFPEQWLVLYPAWVEDEQDAQERGGVNDQR